MKQLWDCAACSPIFDVEFREIDPDEIVHPIMTIEEAKAAGWQVTNSKRFVKEKHKGAVFICPECSEKYHVM